MTNYRRKRLREYQENRKQFKVEHDRVFLAFLSLIAIGISALVILSIFWPK